MDPSIPLFDKQPSDNPAHPESKYPYDCLALSVSDTKDAIPEYREVQRDSTPEIEVFHVLFERCLTHTENTVWGSKQVEEKAL